MEKLYALLGMGANSVKDTLFKTVARADGGSRILLFYALKCAIIAAVSVPLVLVAHRGRLIHGPSLAFALPIAALTGLAYLASLRSLVHGSTATNVTIFRLNFVLSSAAGVLLRGEAVTPRKTAGTLLCLLALLLFYLGARSRGRAGRRGLGMSLLACVAAAGLNLLNKTALAAGASVLHLLLYRYLLISAVLGLVLLLRREPVTATPRLAATASACALLMVGSVSFALTALATGDLSLVIPISSSSFLVTALLSFLVLREPLDWGIVAGLVAAAAGVVVIR